MFWSKGNKSNTIKSIRSCSKYFYVFLNVLENNRPQIWIAAFDLEQAATGEDVDPSSPPFWLPAQDVETNNHIAAWGQQ